MVHIGYLLRVEYHDTTPKNSSLTFDTWLLLVIIISHFNLMFPYSYVLCCFLFPVQCYDSIPFLMLHEMVPSSLLVRTTF